jgi:hypothetical protein
MPSRKKIGGGSVIVDFTKQVYSDGSIVYKPSDDLYNSIELNIQITNKNNDSIVDMPDIIKASVNMPDETSILSIASDAINDEGFQDSLSSVDKPDITYIYFELIGNTLADKYKGIEFTLFGNIKIVHMFNNIETFNKNFIGTFITDKSNDKINDLATKNGLFCVKVGKKLYVWQPRDENNEFVMSHTETTPVTKDTFESELKQQGGSYSSKTLKELQSIAKARGMPYSNLKKIDLIAALKKRKSAKPI